ncbi:Receptor-like protein EIX2 [Linum grandiflorum]
MTHNSTTAPAVFLLWLSWMCCCHGSSGAGCSQEEREALLSIKANLEDPSNRLSSWRASNGDCCSWSAVVCDNITGHVTQLHLGCPHCAADSVFKGKISPSLLGLQHLSYLDLSTNDFQGSPIPEFLGSMSSLKSLFLDESGFGGVIPHQLGNLSNLEELGLQAGYGDVLSADSLQWLSGLSSLEYLDLRNVDLRNVSDWLNMIDTVPSLMQLDLSHCRISHNPPLVHVNLSSLSVLDLGNNEFGATSFPSWISHLKSLTSLDLQNNNLGGPIPDELQNLTSLVALRLSSNKFIGFLPDWLSSFRHLRDLDLYNNQLDGKVSSGIGNLTSLVDLNLSFNKDLEGGIPVSFKSLCHLNSLDLSYIKLQQSVSEVLQILGECPASTLERLSMANCQLFGQLTERMGKFNRLNRLSIDSNSISGPLPFSFGELTSLSYANLANNQINGTIPTSFGKLAELENIDISQNSMEGVIYPEIHFANLTKMSRLCASGNQMVLEVGPDSVFPKLLEIINLNSWYIGPEFPKWLQSFPYLKSLDLSNSGISEPIPDWFWRSQSEFYYLNFSHNQIPGRLPNMMSVKSGDSMYDFSCNNLEGPLPVISSNLTALDLSNNFLSGNLLKFLCFNPAQMRDTEFLNLQGNLLSGEIPDCWRSWGNLKVIRLGNNELRGNIPNSIGTLSNLLSLRIQNNSLTGEIPLSVGNCTNLVSIDLGDNIVEGKIPKWIGEKLSRLAIINLRGNQFHGDIPDEVCHLQLLQILDLSHNFLSGNLPDCVNNITAMADTRYVDQGVIYLFFGGAKAFVEYEVLVTQGQVKTYSTILNYVRSLDLSSNLLSGQIPKQITSLAALNYLNLSHNSLSSTIPENLATMESLESLDLSENKLYGVIPPGMASMTFLNHLNVSCNNLSGRIPLSTQLQSFDPSSFISNKGLCGSPLIVNCSSADDFVPSSVQVTEAYDVHWFPVSAMLGYVVGFWVIVGPVAVHQQWIAWRKCVPC